ncbi:MAG: hypothetical protein H6850_01210 [Alphaproteobacteria bacterium]|nr:MAG: hypothetical protein H6850_01210 [Alphaproteobacteria bacterium]
MSNSCIRQIILSIAISWCLPLLAWFITMEMSASSYFQSTLYASTELPNAAPEVFTRNDARNALRPFFRDYSDMRDVNMEFVVDQWFLPGGAGNSTEPNLQNVLDDLAPWLAQAAGHQYKGQNLSSFLGYYFGGIARANYQQTKARILALPPVLFIDHMANPIAFSDILPVLISEDIAILMSFLRLISSERIEDFAEIFYLVRSFHTFSELEDAFATVNVIAAQGNYKRIFSRHPDNKFRVMGLIRVTIDKLKEQRNYRGRESLSPSNTNELIDRFYTLLRWIDDDTFSVNNFTSLKGTFLQILQRIPHEEYNRIYQIFIQLKHIYQNARTSFERPIEDHDKARILEQLLLADTPDNERMELREKMLETFMKLQAALLDPYFQDRIYEDGLWFLSKRIAQDNTDLDTALRWFNLIKQELFGDIHNVSLHRELLESILYNAVGPITLSPPEDKTRTLNESDINKVLTKIRQKFPVINEQNITDVRVNIGELFHSWQFLRQYNEREREENY